LQARLLGKKITGENQDSGKEEERTAGQNTKSRPFNPQLLSRWVPNETGPPFISREIFGSPAVVPRDKLGV